MADQLRGLDRCGAVVLAMVAVLLLWPGIACLWLVSSADSPMAGWPALLVGAATTSALLLLTSRVWVNLLLVLPLVLFQPVEWYAVHTYHSQVSPAMFAVFLLTNASEAADYVTGRGPLMVSAAITSGLAMAVVWWFFWRRRMSVPLRLRLTLVVPLLLIACVVAVCQAGGVDGVRIHATAAPFTGSALRFVQMLSQRAEVERFAKNRSDFRHGAVSLRHDEPQLVILILGESLRAGNLQINGYRRPTTPRLAAREGLITFTHVSSCSHLTNLALPPALTGVQADDHPRMNRQSSLVAACKEAGFATWWLSNQAPTGRWDELVASYAREADTVRWLNPAPLISEWGTVRAYDDQLLKPTADILRNLPDKALIVLHLIGSHLRYELRYPPGSEVFFPSATAGAGENYHDHPELMRNAYDNSVVMTDACIDACIALHQQTGRAGFVMFIADHGESLMDDANGFQCHGNLPPPPVEFRIPWLVWPSPTERALHGEMWQTMAANHQRRTSSQDLYQTLLHLAGIAIRDADPARCLGSPDFREQPRMLVDIGGRLLDFDRDIESLSTAP